MEGVCRCCGGVAGVAVTLAFRAVAWDDQWTLASAPADLYPLCGPCCRWLAGVVETTVDPSVDGRRLHGSPAHGRRGAPVTRTCTLCGANTGSSATGIFPIGRSLNAAALGPLIACDPCLMWFRSLIDDCWSARGRISRTIDGSYGEFPHPRLRHMTVAFTVDDPILRHLLEDACLRMGVRARPPGQARVTFAAAGVPLQPAYEGTVLLCGFALLPGLRRALAATGVLEWLTVPFTPQQVAAALVMASRDWSVAPQWDPRSCLHVASVMPDATSAIAFEAAPGVDAREVGWLLKRSCRGYDEVVAVPGTKQLAVIPRASGAGLAHARSRLGRELRGRAVVAAAAWATSAGQRFDAAG